MTYFHRLDYKCLSYIPLGIPSEIIGSFRKFRIIFNIFEHTNNETTKGIELTEC